MYHLWIGLSSVIGGPQRKPQEERIEIVKYNSCRRMMEARHEIFTLPRTSSAVT
jgi:hypothetical protein